MAIAKMRKLQLIGLKSERNKIMKSLVRSGLFEPKATVSPQDTLELTRGGSRSHLERVMAKQAKVSFGINFLLVSSVDMGNQILENAKDYKRGKAQSLIEYDYSKPSSQMGRKKIGYDDFYDVAAKEYELINICDELEKISFSRLETKSKIAKLEAINKNLLPYRALEIEFNKIADTKSTFLLVATGDGNLDKLPNRNRLEMQLHPSSAGKLVVIIGLLENKEQTLRCLTENGFSICTYAYERKASDMIKDNLAEIAALKESDYNYLKSGLNYAKYLSDLYVLYDVLGQEIETSKAELDFLNSRDAFLLEGWVPLDAEQRVIAQLKEKTEKVVYSLLDPSQDEEPPTLVVSKKMFAPYEDVTNLYSIPSYKEIDPNPLMAIFFFIFFGIMLGDAGYGIVLSVICFVVLKVLKPDRGMARLIAVVGMGGISAIVWGIVFGGIFGIEGIPPLWFNPMDEPITMLIFSLALGAVHLLAGYTFHAVRQFKDKKPLDGILDVIFVYCLFAAAACIALSLVEGMPKNLMMIGFELLGVALLGILTTNGRHNKGIASKIVGGLSGLYGVVNILSDVLSYARLFGLALASGAIGFAFNTLALMFTGIPVIGWVFAFILLIPLHAFNIGIGVLGAYVHNARLQFLEFYGKFYEGGGRMFSPMGENTKYVRFG